MGTFASSIALLIMTAPIWIFLVGLPLAVAWIVGKKIMAMLFKFRVFKPRLSKQDRLWLIRQGLKDHDTEKIGFNPIKHNYSVFELFPKQPDPIVVNEWRKRIFNLSDLKSEPLDRTEKIKYWYSVFLAMALMRSDMQKQKTWSSAKEQMWMQFPFRPKAMKEVDPVYFEAIRDRYLGDRLENREVLNKLAC
jgi:hypothetical protein